MNFCPNCGTQNDDNAAFCSGCGGSLGDYTANHTGYATATPVEEIPIQPEKKKSKTKLFIIIGAAVLAFALVLSVVTVGYFTDWFGLGSPLGGLTKALANTLQAESGTVKLEEYEINIDSTGEDEDGYDKAYLEAANSFKNVQLRYNIDYDKEQAAFVFTMEGLGIEYDSETDKYSTEPGKSTFFLYKGTMYECTEYGGFNSAYDEDISDELDDAFDYYDRFIDEDGINWKKIIREAELEDFVDADEIEPFLKELYEKRLSDEKWLKQKLGFKKSGKTYTFKPDLEELVDDLYDVVLDSDVLESDARRALRNTRLEVLDEISKLDFDMEISITVKGKYISRIEVKGEIENVEVKGAVTLSNMNKTKIKEDELKSLRKTAEDVIEENTCSKCDRRFYDKEDKENHGDCARCGDHGYIGYGDNSNYCSDCYYDYYYYSSYEASEYYAY